MGAEHRCYVVLSFVIGSESFDSPSGMAAPQYSPVERGESATKPGLRPSYNMTKERLSFLFVCFAS